MLVKRYPFARTELHRERFTPYLPSTTCAWCGERKPWLWQYHIESDANPSRHRWSLFTGLFCSAACFRSYHGPESD